MRLITSGDRYRRQHVIEQFLVLGAGLWDFAIKFNKIQRDVASVGTSQLVFLPGTIVNIVVIQHQTHADTVHVLHDNLERGSEEFEKSDLAVSIELIVRHASCSKEGSACVRIAPTTHSGAEIGSIVETEHDQRFAAGCLAEINLGIIRHHGRGRAHKYRRRDASVYGFPEHGPIPLSEYGG